MKFKGIKCRAAPHLVPRAVGVSPYVEIVRLSDCSVYEKDGKHYYNTDGALSIPISHGATWHGYGKPRKGKYGYTTPFYAVRDGRVYQGPIRHYE